MIASLPMYDRPETRDAYNRLWRRIRDDLRGTVPDLPADLTETTTLWDHWLSPDLILSQTCGLPYRARLHGHVHLVATPDYALPGCPPGYYNSVFVTRPGETRAWPDLTLAINSRDSQSGYAAPLNHADQLGTTFGDIVETGAHRVSAQAVAEGRADIATIDAQTWRMIQRWDHFAQALQEGERTEPTPGLPLITARADLIDALRTAVTRHIETLPDDDRALLDIRGVALVPAESYLAIPTPPLHSAPDRA